jgi:hypothetical protein
MSLSFKQTHNNNMSLRNTKWKQTVNKKGIPETKTNVNAKNRQSISYVVSTYPVHVTRLFYVQFIVDNSYYKSLKTHHY